jgi:hypothetical protein
MAHRVSPRAEAYLDDIWLYVAKESSSIEIASGLIDTITERFFTLARRRYGLAPAGILSHKFAKQISLPPTVLSALKGRNIQAQGARPGS